MSDTRKRGSIAKVTYFPEGCIALAHARPMMLSISLVYNNFKNSLVESHDLLEDRRTELRHTKPYPIAFRYLKISCTRDI